MRPCKGGACGGCFFHATCFLGGWMVSPLNVFEEEVRGGGI